MKHKESNQFHTRRKVFSVISAATGIRLFRLIHSFPGTNRHSCHTQIFQSWRRSGSRSLASVTSTLHLTTSRSAVDVVAVQSHVFLRPRCHNAMVPTSRLCSTVAGDLDSSIAWVDHEASSKGRGQHLALFSISRIVHAKRVRLRLAGFLQVFH